MTTCPSKPRRSGKPTAWQVAAAEEIAGQGVMISLDEAEIATIIARHESETIEKLGEALRLAEAVLPHGSHYTGPFELHPLEAEASARVREALALLEEK